MKYTALTVFLYAVLSLSPAFAADSYQPFVLASESDIGLAEQTEAVIDLLEAAGFELAGRYQPLDDATVLVVTSDVLKEIAAQSDRGGYAAGQRVSVALRNGHTEVSFVNPLYLQYAYRLGADMQPIHDLLVETLGKQSEFGAEKKMTAKKLAKYNYMIGMQKFDDPSELARFDDFEAAVAAVEAGLARQGDALTPVYRIDIPGKQQAVFGVGMKATGTNEDELDIDEAKQLSVVDFEGPAKVAYFPYEILVNGTQVEALHMRFRMAVHFPDLSMMGQHGFTKLMSSPGATEDTLEALVSGD